MTGNQEQLRVIHPDLKKLSIFSHFKGVKLDAGPSGADTIIVRLPDMWFWLIPLSLERTSVGLVMDQAEFTSRKQSPEEVFWSICRSSSEMRDRMEHAEPLGPIQTTGDFSYYNRRLVGRRLVRVGDAAGFMDPIFSAGVYLAMHSAKLASELIKDCLDTNENPRSRLREYEKRVFRAMEYYWVMVEKFYTPMFIELFMEPPYRLKIPDAIVAILAGELDGGWRLEWRRRLFFLLIRLQKFWPVVPRVDFREKSA